MKKEQNKINRRNFLKTVGAAGLGSVLASTGAVSGANEPSAVGAAGQEAEKPGYPQVPKRKLGKLTQPGESGMVPVEVASLSLGTMFNIMDNQITLREALKWGVTYWDTAYNYAGGNSELGIGKFLARHPEVRKKLFIATKASNAKTIEDVERRLQESLKRMKTDYVDLFYGVHILTDPALLTDDLRKWAESAKKRKLIRFFGFSTHKNMAQCLKAAAGLDWIDAIMVMYNFRLMQDDQMQAGIEACYKAGIGLTAMKTQGRGQVKEIETEADKKLTERFLNRGFTAGQAKIKAVLADKRISSVAVGRGNVRELVENAAAVLDKTRFTPEDMKVFRQVSQSTCHGYCAACAHICDSALPGTPYVSDIMRYLMYHNSYGEKETARALFAEIPAQVKERLAGIDYRLAEARCPQHLPIAELMAEAVRKLA